MLADSRAFSGFAVDDVEAAHEFYGQTLGLRTSVDEEMGGMLTLHLTGDRDVLVYPKPDHQPAGFTILNFPVDDIDAAVAQLAERGVRLLRYDGFDHADNGVVRGPVGPAIGWFTDPAGNVLSVLQPQDS